MCKRTPPAHCGKVWSAKWALSSSTGSEPGRRGGGSNIKTGHGALPAACIRWILTLGWLSLLAVCCVYSYTADGSFKTERLKTGGSSTTKLFSESFLQFFHCQSQLRDVCYGQVTREKRTSTCTPGNFCVSPNIRSVTRHCVSFSECFFHSAPCPLLPSPSFWILLHTILNNLTHSACCHNFTASFQESSRSWPHLAHFGATAKTLHFPASYPEHHQAANSASSRDFAQQSTDNTSDILIATSL